MAGSADMTTYYHGTTANLLLGAHLSPEHEIGVPRPEERRTYMTTSLNAARGYAMHKASAQIAIGLDVVAFVYVVEPLGRVEVDDSVDPRFEAYMTDSPARIIREVPFSGWEFP